MFRVALDPVQFPAMRVRFTSLGRRLVFFASALIAAIPIVLLLLSVLRHVLFPTPVEVFEKDEAEIRTYVSNLQAGKIPRRSGDNGYAILHVLADHDATYVKREGNCVVITFAFMPTDAVPQLWYSADGFDSLPEPFAKLKSHKFFKWHRIRKDWGYCEWDD